MRVYRNPRTILFLCFFLFSGLALFAQNTSSLPLELLRPRYGEEPRFPKDYVIGELGRGDATEETYRLARQIVAGLASGDGNIDNVVFPEYKRRAALNRLNALGVRSWRVGGGRSEGGGVYSFLVRFLGREKSITGELYLLWQEPVIEEEVSMEPVKTASGSSEKPENTAPEQAEAPEYKTPQENRTVANGAALNGATSNGTATNENAQAETADEKAAPEDANAVTGAAAADSAVADGEKKAAEPIDGIATEVKPEPRLEDKPHWQVDDILLEPPRSLSDGRYGPGGRDMTPYERFF